MATVKCQICIVKDEKHLMTQLPNRRYVHTEKCLEIYEQQEELKKKEKLDWSNLYEYIKELHGLIEVPTRNIKRLHELRNGYDFVEGKKVKRYKQGADYALMLEAYKLQEEKIRWFIRDVLHDGKDASDINKCISLMLNGLNTAWKNRQDKIKQQERIEKATTTLTEDDKSLITFNKTKKHNDEMDISHLL
ncbi:hypothetical protein [Paenibacillus xylaniclasticus]|uniref:hypothetical protein n=1 Tax=Paenibacillus xylaniclasticus TaxID=588083 RepID=UPI000FD7C328|nr:MULTISPECIES: hypothetical protein [Paenibacillus]GFN32457.1 hypothetical protein PCURB6_27170 [Paenibacillus curdlanolyticus]